MAEKLPGPLSLEHFTLGKTLGTGSFGRVRVATHKASGTVWAVKALKKSEVVKMQQVEHMISEKTLLMQVSHPFIVNLVGSFQDDLHLYLVLEYVPGGEFFTHLRNAVMLENDDCRFFSSQVVSIFAYLHSKTIIYRDLKPENLLLDRKGYLKLTDFGFAKVCPFKTYTLCGTPEYIAPEILLSKGHGKGVDWWTLGILMYEMLAGQPPFVADEPMEIYQQIMEGKVTFPSHFDRAARSIIKKLLTSDLTKRYGCLVGGADDIMQHRYFRVMNWDDLHNRKIHSPIVPKCGSAADDTSQFDEYPEEDDIPAEVPVYEGGVDPFIGF